MKKLNGYRASHRNKWLLIKHKILTLQELSLLEFYVDIMDFDCRHEKFSEFEVDFKEIKEIFNCKSPTTIRNWHSKLLLLGFISKTEKRGFYKISCPKRYISPGKWQGEASFYSRAEKGLAIENILSNFGINLQPNEEIN